MNIGDAFTAGVKKIVETMGQDMQIDRGGTTTTIKVAITSIPKEQGKLINSLGIDGSIAYVLPVTPKPEKFDTITAQTGTVYTVFISNEILVSGALVGHKLGLKK